MKIFNKRLIIVCMISLLCGCASEAQIKRYHDSSDRLIPKSCMHASPAEISNCDTERKLGVPDREGGYRHTGLESASNEELLRRAEQIKRSGQ